MGLVAQLASLLGLEVDSLVNRAKSTALVYGLISIFVFAAAAFLVAAGYIALAERMGPVVAALIMAGGFLLMALVVYLVALVVRRRREQRLARRRRASETGALISTAAITALPLLARSPLLLRLGIPAAALAVFALLHDSKDDD